MKLSLAKFKLFNCENKISQSKTNKNPGRYFNQITYGYQVPLILFEIHSHSCILIIGKLKVT